MNMRNNIITTTAAALLLTLSAAFAAELTVPEGGIGFLGGMEGKLGTKDTNGLSFTIKVEKVTAEAPRSKAANPESLIGKEVKVLIRLVKTEAGANVPAVEDQDFVKALQPDQALKLRVVNYKGNDFNLAWNGCYPDAKPGNDLKPK